jgi:hypothetical protein
MVDHDSAESALVEGERYYESFTDRFADQTVSAHHLISFLFLAIFSRNSPVAVHTEVRVEVFLNFMGATRAVVDRRRQVAQILGAFARGVDEPLAGFIPMGFGDVAAAAGVVAVVVAAAPAPQQRRLLTHQSAHFPTSRLQRVS